MWQGHIVYRRNGRMGDAALSPVGLSADNAARGPGAMLIVALLLIAGMLIGVRELLFRRRLRRALIGRPLMRRWLWRRRFGPWI